MDNNTFVKISLFVKLLLIMTRLGKAKNCPASIYFVVLLLKFRLDIAQPFLPVRGNGKLYTQASSIIGDVHWCYFMYRGAPLNWALIKTENLPMVVILLVIFGNLVIQLHPNYNYW